TAGKRLRRALRSQHPRRVSGLAADPQPPPPRARLAHLRRPLRMEAKLLDGWPLLCESAGGAGDRELKRRRWGCFLPRCLAVWWPTRCAPRCGTRAVDRGLPVLGEPPVGELGLGGELLVEPVLFLGHPDADPFALLPFGAGHQLESAQFL